MIRFRLRLRLRLSLRLRLRKTRKWYKSRQVDPSIHPSQSIILFYMAEYPFQPSSAVAGNRSSPYKKEYTDGG